MVVRTSHPTAGSVDLVRSPMNLSRTPAGVARHPPLLGEHTEEVLADLLGTTQEEVEALRAQGVI